MLSSAKRIHSVGTPIADTTPIGFIWNAQTYSCAYDSLFFILLSVMKEDLPRWNDDFADLNPFMKKFTTVFKEIANNRSLSQIEYNRDIIREHLHEYQPDVFNLRGLVGTDIYALCYILLTNKDHNINTMYCKRCKRTVERSTLAKEYLWLYDNHIWQNKAVKGGSIRGQLTTTWLRSILAQKSHRQCQRCKSQLQRLIQFDETPPFIPLIINNQIDIIIQSSIDIDNSKYTLRGLIYFGNFHFTSRVIEGSGDIWYNDGMTTGRGSEFEGNIRDVSNHFIFHDKQDKRLSMAIYMLI